ncbi:hypothetical protein Ancab_021653, partial [Ancistrocladus abbreviatus]
MDYAGERGNSGHMDSGSWDSVVPCSSNGKLSKDEPASLEFHSGNGNMGNIKLPKNNDEGYSTLGSSEHGHQKGIAMSNLENSREVGVLDDKHVSSSRKNSVRALLDDMKVAGKRREEEENK